MTDDIAWIGSHLDNVAKEDPSVCCLAGPFHKQVTTLDGEMLRALVSILRLCPDV
jgi:hypothetical protein